MKREQLGYLANKNYLLPRLDFVGKYRVRGFGNDLFGDDGFDPSVSPGVDSQDGSAAYATFRNGDLQEWELGMDLNIPIGYRRQMAAVRNSELKLMREKKILREQEREIIYGLSNALGDLDRTSSLLEVNAQRLDASKRQFQAIQEIYKQDNTAIDLVLESQRRVIDAKLDFFRSQVEFMLAVKSIQFEKGTLLQYHNISLSEQGWCNFDIQQAIEREKHKSRPLNYYVPGIKVASPLNEPPVSFQSPQMFETSSNQGTQTNPQSGVASEIADGLNGNTSTSETLTDPETGSYLTLLAKKMQDEENQSKPFGKNFAKFPFLNFSNSNDSKETGPSTLTTLQEDAPPSRANSKARDSKAGSLLKNLPPLKKLQPKQTDGAQDPTQKSSGPVQQRPMNSPRKEQARMRSMSTNQATSIFVVENQSPVPLTGTRRKGNSRAEKV